MRYVEAFLGAVPGKENGGRKQDGAGKVFSL